MSDKGRVIIADDHGLFRQGLRQLLESEGYAVEAEASSGDEALLAVAEAKGSGVFHLSGAEEMTYADFARRLASCSGADVNLVRPISSADVSASDFFRPEHPALGMKRTSKLLGITPEPAVHLLKQILTKKLFMENDHVVPCSQACQGSGRRRQKNATFWLFQLHLRWVELFSVS